MEKNGLPKPVGMIKNTVPNPYISKKDPQYKKKTREYKILSILEDYPYGIETNKLKELSGFNSWEYFLVIKSLETNGKIIKEKKVVRKDAGKY